MVGGGGGRGGGRAVGFGREEGGEAGRGEGEAKEGLWGVSVCLPVCSGGRYTIMAIDDRRGALHLSPSPSSGECTQLLR